MESPYQSLMYILKRISGETDPEIKQQLLMQLKQYERDPMNPIELQSYLKRKNEVIPQPEPDTQTQSLYPFLLAVVALFLIIKQN